MGSLENGAFAKRTPFFRSSLSTGRGDRHPFLVRPRSRFARFLLFEKVDYLQLICTIAVFFFVVILFQAFLPVSVTEKSSGSWEKTSSMVSEDMGYFKDEIVDLDFGEGVRFVPSKLLEKFSREAMEGNLSVALSRPVIRAALRRPQLALVVADLSADGMQLMMTGVAISLQEIGYSIQVYSLEDGPVHSVWKNLGFSVTILQISNKVEMTIDWLNYDGILVNSLEARDFVSGLLQEPFKSVPVIWTIHERALAFRLRQYTSNGQILLINDWKRALNRATVVVFPNYILPMMYSTLDAGNYYVIPGSADEAWEAYNFLALYNGHDPRVDMGYESNDLIVAIAGSHFSYNGSWLEHALVLQALVPLIADFPHDSSSGIHLKVGIISGNSSSAYEVALEVIALKLGYPRGTVRHIGIDRDVSAFLSIADLVIYGSFLEGQSFPPILIQAMCLGKPVIAPDLAMIRKYIDDRVNGYLFPKDDIGMLTQVIFQAISKGTLSLLAQNIASIARGHAKNLMVSDTIEGYAMLLENVIKFPSEVAMPKAVSDIPLPLKQEWQWHLFEGVDSRYANKTLTGYNFLYKLEDLSNPTSVEASLNVTGTMDVAFSITDWEEAKLVEMENARKRREEEEMKDRTDQPHGTWEEVYRSAKRADRTKNELHERDDRELERTGQPLCIYEPYFGEGTWPLLHRTSLYRGIGLSTKGRRPGFDDIDAPSRLPLLNDPYYRDVLGEYGAFFALANRIDRIHKNAWIGFQSWRASARKAALSKTAERMLLEVIQARKHGDALYFWVRMDKDPRNPLNQDFWSFCDAVNAGNCRFAVSEALRKMYGIKRDWDSLPPMPMDGDTWSVMYSWALPTRSFLEFVMFSRMFVDALDAQIYDEHHQSGYCYLSLSKDRHCYSRVLELLVNVWAYHSARRMVYVNPETGVMHEHHKLKSRRGQLWVRWFSFTTLKSMDEDLAEEWDSEHPERRWLWPSTGEIFWQGVYERERHQRHRQREEKRQHSKDKISRMRRRAHQKALGKYVKPPLEEMGSYNSTLAASNHS